VCGGSASGPLITVTDSSNTLASTVVTYERLAVSGSESVGHGRQCDWAQRFQRTERGGEEYGFVNDSSLGMKLSMPPA
jgi:hypothetical protein